MRLKGVEHMKMFCFNNAALHPLLYGVGLFFNATCCDTALMKKKRKKKKKKKMIQNLSECGIWIWMVIFDSFLVNFRTANFRAISPKSFIWCPSSFFDHSLLAESPLQRNVSTIPLLTRRKDLMNLMDSFFKISKKKKKLTLKSAKPHIFWATAKRFWSNY